MRLEVGGDGGAERAFLGVGGETFQEGNGGDRWREDVCVCGNIGAGRGWDLVEM